MSAGYPDQINNFTRLMLLFFKYVFIFKYFRLNSAYFDMNNKENDYTTWKIREDGEHIQTLDYIFHTVCAYICLHFNNLFTACYTAGQKI